ncbi:DNA-binding transcriptional LysR family regulator [Comamonas odontotermitis]|uniref:DNA-binding transcriptional LysR family regulator n=2 Tax=Comamonas odontotermitis TaxID=379895 RepID=A0ABR6REY0_9BURK|nr:DNA-binding transcriptional LysR family regulator [Comamonas odontotermitis]
MMHDLNDMYYFAEVVERGGFAAAGRALGIPKSRLSRRIAELEGKLGVRLLQRTTRRLSLTDAGETFLRHCQSVREAAQNAQAAIEQTQREPSGTVRVSCPVTLSQGIVGALLPEFLRRHPKVRIEMMVSNRTINLLEEGIDVALRVRVSLDDSGSLVVKRLGMTRQVLVASPELLAIHGEPTSPQDLGTKLPTLALNSADGHSTLQLQTSAGEPMVLHHQARYVADDLVTLKYAVMDGIGVYWMPDYMVREELERGDLVEVLKDWRLPEGIFHAAFVSRRNMAPALRVFLDYLGEKLPQQHPRLINRLA